MVFQLKNIWKMLHMRVNLLLHVPNRLVVTLRKKTFAFGKVNSRI